MEVQSICSARPLAATQQLVSLGSCLLSILFIACSACSPQHSEPKPLAVEEIAPGVFAHQGHIGLANPQNLGDIANIGFIIGRDAVAVIDAGGSYRVGVRLLAAIRARTRKPVKYLILTHAHPDHTLGASAFKDAGATIIGHARLETALAARSERYMRAGLEQIGPEGFAGTMLLLPDESIKTTRELDLGDRILRLEAHPVAHTDADLTVLDVRTGLWWVSDLVFMQHVPTLDGSLNGWLALLEQMRTRDVTMIVPGHGPVVAEWPQASDAQYAYLHGLADQTRQALADGVPMRVAAERTGRNFSDQWHLFEEFNPRNAIAAYAELEWE